MKRIVMIGLFGLLALGSILGIASAQIGTDEINPAFSNEILSTLGYQEIVIGATEVGFDVPSEIGAGYALVTLESLPETFTYVNFIQIPDDLSEEEAREMALESARDDIAHEGWVYGGGSYAMFGEAVTFIVKLAAGEWTIAASSQGGMEGEEVMYLYPLTVTASDGPGQAPPTDYVIELNDTEFILPGDSAPSGPAIYEFTNVGEAPRQMVLWKSPREIAVEDFQAFFASFETGTPGPEVLSQIEWKGYSAIISAGQTVWLELDLEPGIYTPTSWVVDPETGMPALLLGMIANFEVVE
jgi:hypothetical protein